MWLWLYFESYRRHLSHLTRNCKYCEKYLTFLREFAPFTQITGIILSSNVLEIVYQKFLKMRLNLLLRTFLFWVCNCWTDFKQCIAETCSTKKSRPTIFFVAVTAPNARLSPSLTSASILKQTKNIPYSAVLLSTTTK